MNSKTRFILLEPFKQDKVNVNISILSKIKTFLFCCKYNQIPSILQYTENLWYKNLFISNEMKLIEAKPHLN